LHQCAFLMDASEKQQRCTGAARLAEKLGGLRSRAGLRLAGERNDTILSLLARSRRSEAINACIRASCLAVWFCTSPEESV
jgi:hypothetical protein